MRRTLTTLLVGSALLGLVAAASAQQSETQMLRDTVKQLQDQLKAVMDRLQQLEAKQAAPAAPAATPKPSWTDKLSISGYWHTRYEAREGARDDFTFRRMYLNFVGNWNEKTQSLLTFSRIPLSTDPGIELEAAQVTYRFADDWSATAGQAFNSFGWDTWESSSKRLPFERWAAGEGVAGRPDRPGIRGLHFRGATDRGLYLTRHARGNEPTMIFGLINGNFAAADNDDTKTLSLDLRFKRANGLQFGGGLVHGKYTETVAGSPVTTDRQAVGLYFHSEPRPWGFQAEFLDGELFGADVRGFYGQAAYNWTGKGTPYIRYEQYDPNRAVAGNNYNSLRIGWAYQVDKNNELTFEFQDADASGIDYGQTGLQWQFGF